MLRDVHAGGSRMPVVILSARDDTDVKVTGLERGANDYVTKPFRFEELLARVRVRLRDSGAPERQCSRPATSCSTCRTQRASVDGESIELSAEFTMLKMFLRHPPQVLTASGCRSVATTATTTTTSSTSTSATCGASSARSGC